jgi:SAM-dependent methyltransferase
MTHEKKVSQWIGTAKIGAEIGAGGKPVLGLNPPAIQIDCFKSFGTDTCTADFYGHACALPFHDHTLDYVIASHVLEHVANPVAALAEWYRVVRPGGIIYLVVPNRLSAWDHTRELTTVEHMLDDYVRGTTARDASHIDEFVFGVDWARYSPTTAPEDVPAKQAELARGMHEAIARDEDINIHFHTFEPSNVRELLETLASNLHPKHRRDASVSSTKVTDAKAGSPATLSIPRFNWEIVDLVDGFPAHSPNGVLAILRVHKGWRARADAEVFRLRTHGDPHAVLRDDAVPFAAWAASTPGLGGVQ